MNTHESYVSLTTAELLKEAGFDWSVNDYYVHRLYIPDEEKWEVETFKDGKKPCSDEYYPRPSLSVAQRWLREVKGYDVFVVPCNGLYFYRVRKYYHEDKVDYFDYPNNDAFHTYEEAQEAGIKNALEIILEKGGEK